MKIHKKNFLNLIDKLHNSEKSYFQIEKYNTYVFKVHKKATKKEIKIFMNKIFGVEVYKIKTLIVKGKIKKYKKYLGFSKNWKKAYVSIKQGYNLDLNKEKIYLTHRS